MSSRKMTRKLTPISEINKNWVQKKHVYEQPHRYAGEPEKIINRLFVRIDEEKSTERIPYQNSYVEKKQFSGIRRKSSKS